MLKARRRVRAAVVLFSCVVVLLGLGLSITWAHRTTGSVRLQRFTQSLPVSRPAASGLSASDAMGREPIVPLSARLALEPSLDPRKVALGNRLFHETQLSGNNQISCASCHKQDSGGADERPLSLGFEGQLSVLNAPTVWNSSLNFRQFWDGRVATLEEQVDEPILNPREMNTSWEAIVSELNQNDDYVRTFRQLYPTGIQPASIRDAIATYERTLVTPNARFDHYLRGDKTAITDEEKAGYQRFKDYGCVACHHGANVGGNMFQRLGVMEDFFLARGKVQTADLGRMNISGRPRDRYVFKVPSLRNVALTAPYLHDGSVETLEEVISIMGQYQLGREIPPDDVTLLVKFLQTLTGELTGTSL
ncbi:MAG: cytochrome-c peroxidase [Leptolyngbyaceae cyanobacterium MAG.088]|nr:cytochrome-c peroxidase [Leptolyngbyaceae cyanobacterium MAG.088]